MPIVLLVGIYMYTNNYFYTINSIVQHFVIGNVQHIWSWPNRKKMKIRTLIHLLCLVGHIYLKRIPNMHAPCCWQNTCCSVGASIDKHTTIVYDKSYWRKKPCLEYVCMRGNKKRAHFQCNDIVGWYMNNEQFMHVHTEGTKTHDWVGIT